jgi:PAS domain S-box-containing protein
MKARTKKKRTAPKPAMKGRGGARQAKRAKKSAPHAAGTKPRQTAPAPGARGHWVTKEELTNVQDRLREAQETLEAIRSGEVDAVVVSGPNGSHVYSLSSVEQPYRVFVEHMQEGAVTISPEGVVLYANQRFADMLKLPLERVIGSRAEQCFPEPAVSAIFRLVKDGSGATAKHECQLSCEDESRVPVHLSATILPRDAGSVICLVVTDLTVQRGQEELRLAKEVAERASLAKDSFLATLSHELRTPLTPALMSLLALEREDDLTDFVRAELSMIRRNIELETRLIDDLLDLTRIANGKLELHEAPVDLHAILSRASEICRPAVDAKQQRLILQLDARRTGMTGDAVRLQQVLWNLIRNAVKFTPQGGKIIVTSSNTPEGKFQFEVRDTGIGFEPDVEARLFQAFEQSDRAITRQFGGLGLGLAISRSIVEAHGGSIRGRSHGPGTGATFTVILPVQESAKKAPSHPTKKRGARAPAGGHEILIVEDHIDTRTTLQRLLEHRGYRVTAADSAEQALAAAGQGRFDLVISDLGLPDMTGNELMAILRDRHNLAGIAVSGYGMEEDVARSREAGFVHHLTKPIHLDRLTDLIARTLDPDNATN